ncbi:type IV pilus biogenesis/stability protein PilW [Shewanella intestini]|uniref:Type IV pilus biogenesis/stability protein PilW n=1 Tax=Shewanella intestini TaxID=2017544 RepID=A0ABS5I356_9GAMM|nr:MULTISPECIES: type IV pilus biogenesis/stability protein PilW [Shewanella]MBR9728253.1 type IV pilus biogenesis/stability protein PilW [Shewanella intestini]MRG35718.1 type IV pilus biogenesis/stability protein PilW [Shewanella sp. XMDDZSB0408]
MKFGLSQITVLSLLSVTLSGCVTERTYSGTDVPVVERTIDTNAAARERMQLGLKYLSRGNAEQAKYNLDKAVDYAPQLSEVYVALAYFYQTVGDVTRTEQAYEKAINRRDASGDARNNYGVFLCQQGKFDRSEKMLLAAIDTPKYTRTASSYENLGVCSRKAGDNAKARNYFTMALKYDPRRKTSLHDLIELAMEDADYSSAQQHLIRYHNILGETAESLALGIKIERELNDTEAMKRFGILLIAKFPKSQQAKEYRANMQ